MLDALKRKRVEDIFRQIRSRQSCLPRRISEVEPDSIVQVLAERIVALEARVNELEKRA